jgi:hypothetical protein
MSEFGKISDKEFAEVEKESRERLAEGRTQRLIQRALDEKDKRMTDERIAEIKAKHDHCDRTQDTLYYPNGNELLLALIAERKRYQAEDESMCDHQMRWQLMKDRIAVLEGAMQEFVDRCDIGHVRSKYTYAKFKKILAAQGAES